MKKISLGLFLLIMVFVLIALAMQKNKEEIEVQDSFIEFESSEVFSEVTIASVNMRSSGFIVAREMINKKLGQIIEISPYLESGIHTNITIPLYGEYEPDTLDVSGEFPLQKEVILILYGDDGDKGFNPTQDSILFDNNDKKIAIYANTGERVQESYLQENTNTEVPENATEVLYTDSGFVPKEVSIEQGEVVVFINKSSQPMWVASDNHPQHDILSSFDQYGTSQANESYWYTFEQQGTWNYHDHVNASMEGVVVVK